MTTKTYPPTIPRGTPFRAYWPTGKPALRKTWDVGKLCSSPYGPVYVVYDGVPPHGQTLLAENVIWDPEEQAEALEKLRIADECY